MGLNKDTYNRFETYSSGSQRYLGIDAEGKLKTANHKTRFKIFKKNALNTNIKTIIEYAQKFFKNYGDKSNEVELSYLNEGLKTLRIKYQNKVNASLWHRFLSVLYSIFKWKTGAQTNLDQLNTLQSSVEDKIKSLEKKKFLELIDVETPLNIEKQETEFEGYFVPPVILEECPSPRLQALKLPSEHHLRSLLDPKMVGHVLGGFMIGSNKNLEGNNFEATLSYMIAFIQRLQEGEVSKGFETFIQIEEVQKLHLEFSQAKEFARKLESLSQEMHTLKNMEINSPGARAAIQANWKALEEKKVTLAQEVIHSLRNLPKGQSFLMSGGWSGSNGKSGHAMLYRFTKDNEGSFTIEIINTGAGLGNHSQLVEGTKLKSEPVRRFEKVAFVSGELDLSMIQGFLDCNLLPFTTEEYEFNSEDIYYSAILERITKREVIVDPKKQDEITGQRSGVCAWKSVLITVRRLLLKHSDLGSNPASYKVFKHLLEMNVLVAGVQNLAAGSYRGPLEYETMQILQRSARKMMESIRKLRYEERYSKKNKGTELLTKEQAREAYNICKQLLKTIEEYRVQPFKPYHPPIEPSKIYSAAKVAQAIGNADIRINDIQIPPVREIPPRLDEVFPTLSDDPQVFVTQFTEVTNQVINYDKTDTLKNHLFTETFNIFGYASQEEMWKKVAEQPLLLTRAIDAINKLTEEAKIYFKDQQDSLVPAQAPALLQFYSLTAFLVMNQANKSPFSVLKSQGFDFTNFIDLEKEFGLCAQFDLNYQKNLRMLERLNQGKENFLFNYPSGSLKFEEENEFESVPDLIFLEKVLINTPLDIQNQIQLEREFLACLNIPGLKLGTGLTEKTLRLKVLKLFTQKNNERLFPIASDVRLYHSFRDVASLCKQLINKNGISKKVATLQAQGGSIPKLELSFESISKKWNERLFEELPKIHLQDRKPSKRLFDKLVDHQPQNELLVRYSCVKSASSELHSDKEVHVACSEPHLQIDHLIDYITANSDLLDDPYYQIFFTSKFLERDILSVQLQAEPKLAEKLFQFLERHWKLLSQRSHTSLPHLNSLLFLTDLTHRIFFYYAKDRNSELIRVAPQIKNAFDKIKLLSEDQLKQLKIAKEQATMPWIKSWINNITLICRELVLDKETIDFDSIKESILNQAEARKCLSQTRDQAHINLKNKYLGAQQIFLGQAAMEKMRAKMSHHLALNAEGKTTLLNQLLGLYGMPSFAADEWRNNFPIFHASRNGHHYKVNVLTGEVSCDNRSEFILPEWCRQHPLLQKLFADGNWPTEFSPLGLESFRCVYQDRQIDIIVNRDRFYIKTLQIRLNYQGRNYILLDQATNRIDIPLPASLMQESLQWMSSEGDPRLVIFNKDMKEVIAHVHANGEIKKGEKTYVDLAVSPMSHIGNFERFYCLAWNNVAGELEEINYRGYQSNEGHPLCFNKNEDKFYWKANPKLFIARNQSAECLRGYPNYLLLEDAEGVRYAVLPCYNLTVEKPHLKIPYFVVPLKDGELAADSTVENLYIANIHFKRGDFARAYRYLKQTETSLSYTLEERKLIIDLLKLESTDPWASLTRIYAAQQLIDNVSLIPPSRRELSEEEKNFLVKDLNKKIAKDFENFVSNRNVPERYKPEVVLGKDRLLRLLQMEGIAHSIPVGEYLWELSEGHYSNLQQVRYPSKTPIITWEKVEKTSDSYMWDCLSPQVNGNPEYLMRPGSTFKNRFNEFYAQALSDNATVRNKLKERLNFMSHERKSNNLWLAQMLLRVIKLKEENSTAVRELPPLYTRETLEAAVQERYKEEIAWYTQHGFAVGEVERLRKIEISRKKVALNFISALEKATAQVSLEFTPINLKSPEINKPANKNVMPTSQTTPQFSKISYPSEVLGREIKDFTINNTLDVKKVEVLQLKELDELKSHLNLNPYVLGELHKLNNTKLQKDSYFSYKKQSIGKFKRIAKLVHAIFFTIFTGGVAFAFAGVRQLWWQIWTGKEEVKVLVSPEKPIDAVVSKHLDYTWNNKGELNDLRALLQTKVKNSKDKAAKAQKRILEIVNKETLDDDKNLQLNLLRGSEKEEPYTLEKCLSIFLNDEWHLFKTRTSKLTDVQINALHALIVMYLVESIAANKGEQALKVIEPHATMPVDSAQKKVLLQELGPLLQTTRYYDINTSPAMLLFEYASGWSINEKQVSMLSKLFSQDAKGNYHNVILQLIMGGGKSKVISPIQACMKANGKQLSLLVAPDALFETNRADFDKTFKKLFGGNSKCLLFSREDSEVNYLKTVLYTLEEAVRHRECVLTRPKDLLCLDIEHFELRKRIEESNGKSKDLSKLREKAALLRKILAIVKTTPTVDETDTVFHCKYQVNFTTGQPMAPEKIDTETVAEIYRLIATDKELRSTIRLHENKQHLLTQEQWERIKKRLTHLMVKQIQAKYKIPLEEKDLHLYCEGRKGEVVETTFIKLYELYLQNDSKVKEGIRKLGLLKREMEQLLQDTLKKNTNTHYGLSKKHPELGYAIPYSANNTPNEMAQFADADETRNKTFQTCLSNWNEPVQTKQLVEYTRNKVQDLRKKGHLQEAQKLEENFKQMSGKELFDLLFDQPANIEIATKEIHSKLTGEEAHEPTVSIILDYIYNIALQQQMKIYRWQLNGSTQDLESMFAATQGYTGTLGSTDIYGQRIVTVENIETDLLTIQALKQNSPKIHSVDNENPSTVLKTLLERHEDSASFRAFIDCGALFKGKSNLSVATEMLDYFIENRSPRKAVLYWDDTTNIPTLIFKKGNVNSQCSLPGTSKEQVIESCKKYGLSDQDIFVYYDQRHTIGSDIFFPDGVKSFTTSNTQIGKDALLQGVMRMRKLIAGGHQTEFVLHKEELAKMSQIMLGNQEGSLKVEHLVAYGAMFQATNEREYHYDAMRQMLVACIRKYFRDKILEAKEESVAQHLSEIVLPIVTTGISVDPFLDYGPILTMVDTRKALKRYANWLTDKVREKLSLSEILSLNINKLEDSLSRMIDQQISKQSMANQVIGRIELEKNSVKKSLAQHEKLTEQNRELEQKAEKEREFEQEKLMPPPNIVAEQAFEWSGDIFASNFSFVAADQNHTGNSQLLHLDNQLNSLGFGGLIDKNVLITEDFLKTAKGQGKSLFNSLQKGVYDVLVVKEAGKHFCILLSAHEAVFFKKQLANQKMRGGSSSQRSLWLVNSQGGLIQEGAVEWTKEAYEESQHLLIQTLFLSGNIFNMNQHKEKLELWVQQGNDEKAISNRRLRLGQLLNKLHDRLPPERLKLQADLRLQALFAA